jgi:hypothetical protein
MALLFINRMQSKTCIMGVAHGFNQCDREIKPVKPPSVIIAVSANGKHRHGDTLIRITRAVEPSPPYTAYKGILAV